jgi:large subunit ribosomal protein L28
MSKVCTVCGKRRSVGGRITRRGMAKKKGGIGTHVVKDVKRVFSPNVQKLRLRVNGGVKRQNVCMACLRSGKVQKA